MSEPESGPSPAGQGERGGRAGPETAQGAEMMDWARAAGPNSEEVAYLHFFLKENGLITLMELHRTGRLIGRMRAAAITPLPPPSDDWQESADGLIYSSVQRSLEPFFASAVFGEDERRWRPGGASVQDYFVNKCIFTLKDLYIQEYERCCPNEIPCGDFFDEEHEATRVLFDQASHEDPEMVSVYGDELRNISPLMTEKQAWIALEKSNGRSHKEIGLDLQMTDAAVSSSLWRLRRRIDR